jgi:hypothetical protein
MSRWVNESELLKEKASTRGLLTDLYYAKVKSIQQRTAKQKARLNDKKHKTQKKTQQEERKTIFWLDYKSDK